jgi:MFS family permease
MIATGVNDTIVAGGAAGPVTDAASLTALLTAEQQRLRGDWHLPAVDPPPAPQTATCRTPAPPASPTTRTTTRPTPAPRSSPRKPNLARARQRPTRPGSDAEPPPCRSPDHPDNSVVWPPSVHSGRFFERPSRDCQLDPGRCPKPLNGALSGSRSAPTSRARVLADREYRGLWVALALSLAGDQLAQVALAVLVFTTTGSAVATAGTYALTIIPALLGGPLLSGLGDRYSRRAVMLGCDLACAGLVAVMAVPGLGVLVLCGLLFVVALLACPFAAARAALIRDVFPDDRYTAAVATTQITRYAALIAGFITGGLLLTILSPRQALLLDAATFALSAAVVRLTVRARPAAHTTAHAGGGGPMAGLRLVFGDPTLRRLTCYAWLACFHVAPLGVVLPLTAAHGGGPVAVGLMFAATSTGAAISMTVISRRIPQQRRIRLMVPLSFLAAAPFILCWADPPLPATAALWALAGAGAGYQLAANTAFVTAVPNQHRSQAFGIVAAGLNAGQGTAILAAGALTELIPPATVVAAYGLAGTLAAAALARPTPRTDTRPQQATQPAEAR